MSFVNLRPPTADLGCREVGPVGTPDMNTCPTSGGSKQPGMLGRIDYICAVAVA